MKSVLPLLLLGSLGHGAVCPTGQLKDQAALVQIEHVWLRAVEQHDVAALGCILADEFEEADFAGSLIDRHGMMASAANRRSVQPAVATQGPASMSETGMLQGSLICDAFQTTQILGCNAENAWPPHL